jgi:4-amino-4-deoxy-L-arabinose transferase-like glycosyltransferase
MAAAREPARLGLAASLGAVTVLAATLFFFHLGVYGLWEPDEARYAEIAREMLAARDFVVPHLNYVPYIEKPPLLYWLTACSFAIGGLNEFAARLVPATAALTTVIATWMFAARVFDYRRAMLAGAILATAPLFAVMAQVLTTDMLLTSFVTVSLFAFFLAWSEGGAWRWLLYIAMGLGTLTKGPVAIVIPAAVAIAFLIRQRDLRGGVSRLRPASGALLTFAIAAPWFLIVSRREAGFAGFYFVGEHLHRFLDPNFEHAQALYFYVPVLILGFLPWSIILPLTVPLTGLFGRWKASANRSARDFCLVAAAVIFGFFSLASGKLIPYVLPAFPPLAIAIADSVMSIEEHAGGSRRFAIAAMTTMALIGALMLAAPFAGLSTPYLSLVRPALLAAGLIAIAGGAMAGLSIARGRVEAAPAIVVLAIAAALIAGSYGRLEAEPLRSYAGLCRTIAAQAPAGSTLICYRRYVQGLPYYNRQRIVLVGAPSELNFGMEHSEDAASWFLTTDDELFRLWDTRGPKVLVIDESDLERLRSRLGNFTTIASEGRKLAILRAEEQLGSN